LRMAEVCARVGGTIGLGGWGRCQLGGYGGGQPTGWQLAHQSFAHLLSNAIALRVVLIASSD
jgi:hypothetical protein